jgi:acetyl esterase
LADVALAKLPGGDPLSDATLPGVVIALGRMQRPLLRAVFSLPCGLLRFIARRRQAIVDGQKLDLEMGVMLAFDDLLGQSDLSRLAPPAARRRVAWSVAEVELPAARGVSTFDATLPGPAGPLPYRLYVPSGLGERSALLVFIHGGGWVTGGIATHDRLCRFLARRIGCRAVSVGYRLAPESPFPAAADDVIAAFRFFAMHASELGADTGRFVVMGDSAGGNLSAVVSAATIDDDVKPALQVLLYPALDAGCSLSSHRTFADDYFLTRTMIDWYYGHYRAGAAVEDPKLSPLFSPDPARLPATHVYTAGFDPLRDEGHAYAERLTAAGVTAEYRCFDDLIHGFAMMGGAVTRARQATEEIAARTAQAIG